MVLEIISYLGGTGALVLALTFLVRQLVLHRLSKDLATYRCSLEAERDRQVQSLRHEFEKAALEHRVSFQQIYVQRHDALKDLHGSLRECLKLCLEAAHSGGGDSKVPLALQALEDLQNKVLACEIYLPRTVCDRWLTLFVEMSSTVSSLREARAVRTRDWDADRKELASAVSEHAKAWRAMNEGLVDDIRDILGLRK